MLIAHILAVILFVVMFVLIVLDKIERHIVTLGCGLLTLILVFGLAMRSGSAILEFLALAGAHQSALAMENARVIKSVRNDVNRQTNAEIANQAKTSRAAIDQIRAIRQVVEAHGMENLPPALQDFIKLRVRHPEATLKELGELANPPLSKSAVYHRVRRIEQLASELDNQNR